MSLSLGLMSMLNVLFCILFFQFPTLHALPVAPISKDEATNLFTISVSVKTPPRPTELYLDLGFLYPWMVCDDANYPSSSFHSIPCNSTFCSNLEFGAHSCVNSACNSFPENPVTGVSNSDKFLIDTLSLPTTKSPAGVHLPNFTFSCAGSSLLKGLPKTASGLATLSRSNLSLHAQIRIVIPPSLNSFALCLPSSSKAPGVAIFASAGHFFASSSSSSSSKSKIDLSESFVYTSLSHDLHSQQYFIEPTGIRINNGHLVTVNETLLTISTATPYTIMESTIHRAFTELFVKEASSSSAFNLTVATSPVKPFSVCYRAKDIKMARAGPLVPAIDFLFQYSENVFWRIFGGNSMVRVTDKRKGLDLWCLGFVDGGINMKTPITIGGKQLEDTLLLIDVESEIFGTTSSLLSRSLSCADVHDHYLPRHKK